VSGNQLLELEQPTQFVHLLSPSRVDQSASRSLTTSLAVACIAEPWGIDDDLGLMRQLGAVPTPGEPAGSFH
jgi:hypothetical protein